MLFQISYIDDESFEFQLKKYISFMSSHKLEKFIAQAEVELRERETYKHGGSTLEKLSHAV